ncbi:MAG: ABC transporter ATP-binding protein [Clostridia bacterium]
MEKQHDTQTGKRINYKLIGMMMNGSSWYLVLSSIFLIIAVLAAYCTPLVISFTVDSVIGQEQGNMPAFMQGVMNGLGEREFLRNNLYICALALIGFTLINALATLLRRRYVALASEGVARKLRNELYWHLQCVPYDYYKHVSTGDLVQRCTSDVETIRRFISVQLLEIVRTLTMVIIACYIMFSLDTSMALVSVALLPILCASSFIYFSNVRKQFELSDEAEGKLSATLQENLTGVRVVRAFGQQRSEVDKFTECNRDFKEKTFKLIRMLGIYWGLSDGFGYIQIALSLFVGIILCVRNDLSLGNLMVFTSYTAMLTWPVRQLGRVLADLGKASVSLGRLDDILAHDKEGETGAALTRPIKGVIEFKNVCFGYDEYDDVLKDITFTAKPGQTIAILGSTGSGKTSLVQLLQRLYTCTAGHIIVDGMDVNDIDHAHLRRNIGIVLQEPFLYSRTIMDNIRIADPQASDEDVFAAARVAAVHDVIMGFENGYDTIVGERGVTLSGGQKQRVAIARMLMQHAPILIFDDSLSAVDTETDAAIRDALRSMKDNATTFIISHRITTLCEADNILVLEHGMLVQQGTHEQLLHEDGLYRRIAAIQDMLEVELNDDMGGEGR